MNEPESEFDPRYADLAETVLTVAREIRIREYELGAIALTSSNAQIMRYIDVHPGASPSEAAEATGLLRSNLSTAIRELESKGFLEKRQDPSDGRGVRLYPTKDAARNLALVRAQWAAGAARVLGGLEDVETATKLLQRLADGLVSERRESGARWSRRQF